MVKTSTNNKHPVRLSVIDYFSLNDSVVAEVFPDSLGRAELLPELAGPTFAYLSVNGNQSVLYLEPSSDFTVIPATNPQQVSRYSGGGSSINNYLSEAVRIRTSIQHADSRDMFSLDSSGFSKRIARLEDGLDELMHSFKDSAEITTDQLEVLKSWNKVSTANLRLRFALTRDNRKPFVPDAPILKMASSALDSKLINLNSREYGELVATYVQQAAYQPIYEDMESKNLWQHKARFPLQSDSMISSLENSSQVLELLRAKNLAYLVSMNGLSESTAVIRSHFLKDYPASSYAFSLQRAFDKWIGLEAGKTAPNIAGVTPNGKDFSLEQLRGKVVYVDVWATWCGPCIEETPYVKLLQKRFSDSDSVAFLAVSVDRNQNAWLKMVEADEDWNAIHVMQPGKKGAIAEILKSYNISMIPRYILIDKEGKIVSANADPPSSGDFIYTAIRQVL